MIVILSTGITFAQNANRSGFLLELGVGGIVGSTPRTVIFIKDNQMSYNCLSGGAVNFGLGYRIRIVNNWAYEAKVEAQIPFGNPIQSLVGRALPIGFRYTTNEIWRNYSLFAHANIGGALVINNGILDGYYYDDKVTSTEQEIKINRREGGKDGFGVAYSVGVGINLTNHFYIEGCFDGQAMFNCYGKNGKGYLNYGIFAFALGYRF